MIKLTEATDTTFQDRFSQANSSEMNDLFKEFFAANQFPGYNEDTYSKFVDSVSPLLYSECKKYTLSMDNPFMQYIKRYATQNGNIDPLLKYDNYAFIHNLIANNIVTEKQLAGTCPENEQIRLLVNPNLFNVASDSDKLYLIQVYDYILSNNLNSYVNNAYVKAIFSDVKDLNDKTKEEIAKVDLNKHKLDLIDLIYFTNYIREISDRGIKQSDTNKGELIKLITDARSVYDPKRIVSAPLKDVNIIENQFKLLKDLTQEGQRADNGQYQRTDVENKDQENNKNRSNQISAQEKRAILSKASDIKKGFESVYNNNQRISNADFKKLLKTIYDEIN